MRAALTTAIGALLLAAAPAALRAQTHLVIVSGLGGEAQYSAEFRDLSSALAEAAHKRFGIPDSLVTWLGEDSASALPYFRGQATRANVEAAIEREARRAAPGDQVAIVLIGHGSGEREDSKISLPGPDLTAADFAKLLDKFPTQKVAFLDFTSASGDVLPILAAPNRVIITATKSALERNESEFARFFVDALTKDVADTDKDGRVSLLEAFRYAATETKRVYDNASKLQTEHAQLDDVGAKQGTAEPDGRTGEGLLARRFFLDDRFVSQAGANDPTLAGLYKEKFALEDQVDQLIAKKATMQPDAYDDALEALLVQLARKAQAIRGIERGAK